MFQKAMHFNEFYLTSKYRQFFKEIKRHFYRQFQVKSIDK